MSQRESNLIQRVCNTIKLRAISIYLQVQATILFDEDSSDKTYFIEEHVTHDFSIL